MSPVRLVDVYHVGMPATAALPPEPIKLTAMQVQWIFFPLIQRVFFFEGAGLPPFDTLLQSLRSSLSTTLTRFAPLVGKIVVLPASGYVAISCSASDVADGISFIVAESDADIRLLSGDEEHDVQAFEQLVPELDRSQHSASTLTVQVTRFEGGVAVGVALHHSVFDGFSMWKFFEAWAAECRGEAPATPPSFDRAAVRLPDGEELARTVLRKYAPLFPVGGPASSMVEDRMRFSRRTFTVCAQQVQRLKQRITRLGEAQGAPLPRAPSSFVAIVALAWTSIVRAKPIAADDDVYFFFFADCRMRLEPPVGAGYFGTCLTGCLAKLFARDLQAEHGVVAAASAVQEEISKMTDDPLAGWEWMSIIATGTTPLDRLVNVSGSSQFRAYEAADFGWGKPRRAEPVTMRSDGQVALIGAKDGDGVQVSVSLNAVHMDAFKSQFLGFLD